MSDHTKNTLNSQMQDKSAEDLESLDLNAAWVLKARRATQVPFKRQVSLRIDEDILDFFKMQGSRYQTKMHAVLRAYVDDSISTNKK